MSSVAASVSATATGASLTGATLTVTVAGVLVAVPSLDGVGEARRAVEVGVRREGHRAVAVEHRRAAGRRWSPRRSTGALRVVDVGVVAQQLRRRVGDRACLRSPPACR